MYLDSGVSSLYSPREKVIRVRKNTNDRVSLFPLPWVIHLAVPLAITAVVTLLALTPIGTTLEHRLYDAALSARPAPVEDSRIVLLNIDDRSVSVAGQWPWPRDQLARGIEQIAEFGARRIVLDISFTDPSPDVVDRADLLERVDDAASNRTTDSLSRPQDVAEFVRELTGEVPNPDDALTASLAIVGAVDLPVALREEAVDDLPRTTPPDFPVTVDGSIPEFAFAGGALQRLVDTAEYAGFANIWVDADGVSRRTHLFAEVDGHIVPQLALPAFVDLAEVTDVRADHERFEFVSADGSRRVFDRDGEGFVAIDWPHGVYEETFRQRSYADLLQVRRLEESLATNIEVMNAAGYFAYATAGLTAADAYALYTSGLREARETRSPSLFSESLEFKRLYLSLAGSFLNGDAEARMIGDVSAARAGGQLAAEEADALIDDVEGIFQATRRIHADLTAARQSVLEAMEDRVVFVGFTATGTSDIGVTPFDEEYVKLGLHASILNTLIHARRLYEAPTHVAALVALAAGILIAVAIRRRRPAVALSVGFFAFLVVVAGILIFFAATGIYIGFLIPGLVSVLTFGVVTGLAFVETSREKGWLFNAFEHYISREFVQELVRDPAKLDLGGQERELTALFTDIRGFSSIAENLGPSQLVDLLNGYLGRMSDLILQESGTIDKYEGDAIVSFFGAPVELSDHSARACRAALRIKDAERALNDQYLRDGTAPSPLHTRVGINTGPMVVGNLGTERRMDYTIMGHDANIAARLEGANKDYGTWILVGESTMREAGSEFVFRPLDRARVVGISGPIRLCELVGFRQDATSSRMEALDIFAEGIRHYDDGKWDEALTRFEAVLRIYPDDGPARVFINRCRRYIESPPDPSWDGVYNLTEK